MVDRAGKKMIVARAPYLELAMPLRDRLLALAMPAAREAISAESNQIRRKTAIPVFVGLPPTRPGLPAGLIAGFLERLEASLREHVPIGTIEAIQTGHSSGLMALEKGCRSLQSGGAEFCLIGGVDTYLEPITLEWLEHCGQIHAAGMTNNAWGFIPGEAAGFCLLAAPGALDRYQLTCHCRVRTVATSQEKNLIKTESVCIGKGLSEVVQRVLGSLPLDTRVDQVICDMNGEAYRADEYGFTVARTAERFKDAANFLAPADCWGDVGAASGPLYLGLADVGSRRRYAKGTNWLAWTSSESGERSAALLRISRNGPGGTA
jgi:3-oxoacyl-[acyl-carrier-protein] synthase-1